MVAVEEVSEAMKIKLIAPRMSLRPMDSEYKRVMSPSLALLVLAALTPPEHEVTIADENAGPICVEDAPDLVGITVNVDTATRAYAIADGYRGRGIPVIVGGIHPSANPEEALAHASSVCIGEGEEVWADILRDAQSGALQPRYFNTDPTDLAHVPLPRWDLLDRSRYLYTNIVCASRGCPFACEFCYNSSDYVHHRYRNRPIESVIREIADLGTRHVMFIDDNLIGNIGWTWELVRALKPLGLKWNAAVSANIGAHLDLLDAMKESGCRSLFIGFETVNGDSLRSVRKHQNDPEACSRLLEELHARGIMVNASLAFGFDHDHPDVFRKTLDWLVSHRVETMTAHILTPYPGTVLYRRFEAEGRIVDHDWSHYNTAHAVFTPRRMTREQLTEGYLWMYDQFYSLGCILKRMPRAREQWLPYLVFNLAYRKYGRLTSRLAHLGGMRALGNVSRRLAYGIG